MATHTSNALLDLNSNRNLDFLQSNLNYLSADDNVNPYENLNISSLFYDLTSFTTSFRNTASSIFLNINVQSLASKIDNLRDIILSLANHNINIPVIALQEIWQIPSPDIFSIPGYKLVYKQRSLGRGGGCRFFPLQQHPL